MNGDRRTPKTSFWGSLNTPDLLILSRATEGRTLFSVG